MNRFEDAVHTARREQGELQRRRLQPALDRRRQAAMLGDSVELTEGYGTWWSLRARTSSARPATSTRTRTASCSRCRCTGSTRSRATGFVGSYLELLARGRVAAARGARARSSASTSPIPAFWDGGLEIVEQQLEAAEAAAAATGRVTLPAS